MTINTQKFVQLRDHLNKLIMLGREDKFNMGEWLFDLEMEEPLHHLNESTNPECGTAGCLAGHVVIMDQAMEVDISAYAQETLGLSDREARYMFMGGWINGDLSFIGIDETIEYLDGVIKTGSVLYRDPKKEDEPEDEEVWQTCDDGDLEEENQD
jgi:hypothetical protein